MDAGFLALACIAAALSAVCFCASFFINDGREWFPESEEFDDDDISWRR